MYNTVHFIFDCKFFPFNFGLYIVCLLFLVNSYSFLYQVYIPTVTEDSLLQPVLACCSALVVFTVICYINLHCESKKTQATMIMSISLTNVDQFSKVFNDRFTKKYATKSSLTIPSHLKCVAALPCETSISEN